MVRGPSGTLKKRPGHLLLLSITGGKHEILLHPALSMFGYLTEAMGTAEEREMGYL